jgi:hypothetical protein
MTNKRSFGGLLHRATHRIAGVPEHAERPAGHQGTGAAPRASLNNSLNHRWNHSPTRPARFLPAWQRRIAALFGREP